MGNSAELCVHHICSGIIVISGPVAVVEVEIITYNSVFYISGVTGIVQLLSKIFFEIRVGGGNGISI